MNNVKFMQILNTTDNLLENFTGFNFRNSKYVIEDDTFWILQYNRKATLPAYTPWSGKVV